MYISVVFLFLLFRVWNQLRGHSRLTLLFQFRKILRHLGTSDGRDFEWYVHFLLMACRCWRPHSETKTSEKSGALWELSTSTCGVYFAYFVYFVWVLFLVLGTYCFTRFFFDSAETIEPSSTHRHRPKIPPHGMVKQTEKKIPCLDLQNHSFFSHRPHERPFVPV